MAEESNIIYMGKQETVHMPTGKKYVIRENNGEDESVLSTVKDSMKGSGTNRYLSRIVIEEVGSKAKPTPEDIANWPLKDKYYLLYKARLLSLGNSLEFKQTCRNPDCGKQITFEEDLSIFDDNLDPKAPEEQNAPVRDPNEYRITPYEKGSTLVISELLSSGRNIKFDILTGVHEQKALDMDEEALNRNTDFITRNLSLKNPVSGEWERIYTFQMFSSKDMRELRSLVKKYDKPWEAVSEITCPHCKTKDLLPLMRNPDFFFPDGI